MESRCFVGYRSSRLESKVAEADILFLVLLNFYNYGFFVPVIWLKET